MKPGYFLSSLLCFVLMGGALLRTTAKDTSSPPITSQTRIEIIRTFTAELVYIRTLFPMGKTGLQLKNGELKPNGPELQKQLAMWGPSVKPGDRAQITTVVFKGDRIRFEVNGGPVRKKKWYQHIEVGSGGGTTPIAPSDSNANPRGSYVDLVFEHNIPDLKPDELKGLLRPVFDFNSTTGVEAYLETVPPIVKEAISNHQVLVGMNKEMVVYSKGRPPRKTREKDGEVEYEEWIYGNPPQDVDFIRFVGPEVVRVESMKVDGQKIIKTEKEIDLDIPAVASKGPDQAAPRPANAPSLRRPGEQMPTAPGENAPASRPRSGSQDPGQPRSGPDTDPGPPN